MTVVPWPRADAAVDLARSPSGAQARQVWALARHSGLAVGRVLVHLLGVLLRLLLVTVLTAASALSVVVLGVTSVAITLGLFIVFGHIW